MSDFPSIRYKVHPGNDKVVMQTTIYGQGQAEELEKYGWTGDLGSIVITHPNEGAKPRPDFMHVQIEDVLANLKDADDLAKKSKKADDKK